MKTSYHPSGSLKMGRDDDPMAVVDARLRVRGVENLRVIDCSIILAITMRANTNADRRGDRFEGRADDLAEDHAT